MCSFFSLRDRAPDGRKVERLFVFGNHDAYALQKSGDIFKDPKVLQREAIEADPQKAWDYCFHEEWSPYFKKQSRDLISSAHIGRAVFGVTAMPRQGAPNMNRADRSIYYARYNAPKSMGVEATCHDIRVGQIVSVYDDRIEFEKREFLSGMKLSENWVVELPVKAKSFPVLAKSAKTAEFPAGAKISAVRISAKTIH